MQAIREPELGGLLERYSHFTAAERAQFLAETAWIPRDWKTWQRGLLFFKRRTQQRDQLTNSILELKTLMQEAEIVFGELFETATLSQQEFSSSLRREGLLLAPLNFNFFLLGLDTYWVDGVIRLADFARAMNRTLPRQPTTTTAMMIPTSASHT